MGYSPWGFKESDTTEQLSFFFGPAEYLLNQKLGLRPPQTVKNPDELLLGIKSTETNIGLRVESSLYSSLLCGIPH